MGVFFMRALIITRQIFFLIFALMLSQHSLAQLTVLTCEPEWAALVSELGGNQVLVSSATTAAQDPHHIQARPSLIAKARNADLLVCTGAELEAGWLPLLLQKSGNPKIQSNGSGYFMASDYVELLGKPVAADRSLGDIHMAGNPHIHTSPYNMLQVASALTEKLSALSPANKTLFENNHRQLQQSFDAAFIRWQPEIHSLKNKKLVVHHDYWLYLEKWLQLDRVAVLEPKPGVPPSSTQLSGLIKTLQHNNADVIFYASYNDSKPAEWLSGRTGIPIVAVPATVENWQEKGALIRWYEKVLQQLNGGMHGKS
jgi:zinc/manganese transport system substrate-binding protein